MAPSADKFGGRSVGCRGVYGRMAVNRADGQTARYKWHACRTVGSRLPASIGLYPATCCPSNWCCWCSRWSRCMPKGSRLYLRTLCARERLLRASLLHYGRNPVGKTNGLVGGLYSVPPDRTVINWVKAGVRLSPARDAEAQLFGRLKGGQPSAKLFFQCFVKRPL